MVAGIPPESQNKTRNALIQNRTYKRLRHYDLNKGENKVLSENAFPDNVSFLFIGNGISCGRLINTMVLRLQI